MTSPPTPSREKKVIHAAETAEQKGIEKDEEERTEIVPQVVRPSHHNKLVSIIPGISKVSIVVHGHRKERERTA